MKFFSGFSLKNDQEFFTKFLYQSEYSVAGFSYGAIKAFQYVENMLYKSKRVDTLQLFSPAFFQNKSEKFKRLQLQGFNRNQEVYIEKFLEQSFLPYEKGIVEHLHVDEKNLRELLEYEWIETKLQKIADKGVTIEVYLGAKDKVIDSTEAKEFFLQNASVTYIKDANHFLQTK